MSPTKASKLNTKRQEAMPAVKVLVRRHGRTTISWCLNKLRDYDRKAKQITALRVQAAELEREIN